MPAFGSGVTSPSFHSHTGSDSSILDSHHTDSGVLSPIHYIVIVLMFYMGGLTVLIIKYIQSENEEARYEQYYVEFVKRSKFNRPRLMKEIRSSSNADETSDPNTVTKLTENASFFHRTVEIIEEKSESEEEFGQSDCERDRPSTSSVIKFTAPSRNPRSDKNFAGQSFEFKFKHSRSRPPLSKTKSCQSQYETPVDFSCKLIDISEDKLKTSNV